MHPYVGITDFTAPWQVRAMLEVFNTHRFPGSQRQLHVGVMMSYKTLHGIPSKWKDAFPPKESIVRILSSDLVYNCLHYADYENNPELRKSLSKAIWYGGPELSAIQLDMIWPSSREIVRAVRAHHKDFEVILQVGRGALEAVGNDPRGLVEKLRGYDGVIHRVLLDKSGGEGRGMDAAELLPFARAIREHFPKTGLVVAGGLGPYTMYLAEPIVREFPDVSIDAQARLRPSRNALDPVDWHMAGGYLATALELLK